MQHDILEIAGVWMNKHVMNIAMDIIILTWTSIWCKGSQPAHNWHTYITSLSDTNVIGRFPHTNIGIKFHYDQS